jgi:hypothetical protein
MARPGVEEVVRILASISADKIMLEILQAGYSSRKIRNESAGLRIWIRMDPSRFELLDLDPDLVLDLHTL